MFWITLVQDCMGSHVALFHGQPPLEGIDEDGAVKLQLLGTAEDLDAALGAVESLNALLKHPRHRRREGHREAHGKSRPQMPLTDH